VHAVHGHRFTAGMLHVAVVRQQAARWPMQMLQLMLHQEEQDDSAALALVVQANKKVLDVSPEDWGL